MSQVAMPKKSSGSPAPTTPAGTLGEDLKHSPVVKDAIDTIVSEIRRRSAQITDAKPANPGLKESYESLMKRAAASSTPTSAPASATAHSSSSLTAP